MGEQEVFAGVDLGGTTISGVLATAAGYVLARRQVSTEAHHGRAAVERRIAGLIDELSAEGGCRPAGLGIGCPGAVDTPGGVVKWLPNFPSGWKDTPLASRLGEELQVPVHLLNDVRLAGLGELAYGYGRGRERPTFVVITLGTGVGGAVVVDGRLRLGRSGAAGEIGHTPLLQGGQRCGCGQRGCLETVASMPALVAEATRRALSGQSSTLRHLMDRADGSLSARQVARAVEEEDAAALDLLDQYCANLARGLTGLVVALEPDALVIGGGGAGFGEPLRSRLAAQVAESVSITPTSELAVVLSTLGEHSGCLGGVALAAAGGEVRSVSRALVVNEATG